MIPTGAKIFVRAVVGEGLTVFVPLGLCLKSSEPTYTGGAWSTRRQGMRKFTPGARVERGWSWQGGEGVPAERRELCSEGERSNPDPRGGL